MQKNINPSISGTGNGKTMILSKGTIFNSKKSKFIKKQEADGLLSSLGIKTPLSKSSFIKQCFFKAISLNDLIVIITIL